MADSNFRGPINSMGALEVESGTSFTIEPMDGPSGSYQGYTWLDPRGGAFNKDGTSPGRTPGWLFSCGFVTVDNVPQAASSTTLAAAQVVTATLPMALATVAVTNFSSGAASIAVGVPIIAGGTTVATTAICLDFGFTTGTSTANSTTLQVADNTLFQAGQWLTLGNVANAAGTASMFAQVVAISTSNTTTITISAAPGTALGFPIGAANLFGATLLPPASQFGPGTSVPTAHNKTIVAGMQRITNPREFLARNLSITASTVGAGTATVLCTGLDLNNSIMTELLTASGTTTVYGKKGFKFLFSAVPQTIGTTVSASYSLGIGDTFEFPIRVDEPGPYLTQIVAGGTTVINSVGILAASTVTPSTNTSGDVRGTVQLSGLGAGTPITNVASTNNVLRLTIIQSVQPFAMVNTTPINTVPMFGIAQSTT